MILIAANRRSLWQCVAFASLATFFVAIAHAEIEKMAIPGPSGLSFSWWPKVVVPAGWQHERDQSLRNGINALSPKGASFSDAETVMYAKAVYKPREPNVKSLADFIEKDKKEFLAHEPSLDVRETEALKAKDGRVFRAFSYLPKAKGNWERVAYGEETEFYLVFVLSSVMQNPSTSRSACGAMPQRFREGNGNARTC